MTFENELHSYISLKGACIILLLVNDTSLGVFVTQTDFDYVAGEVYFLLFSVQVVQTEHVVTGGLLS